MIGHKYKKYHNIAKNKSIHMKAKQPLLVGNWKMYKTIEEAVAFVKNLVQVAEKSPADIYLAVPFTAIKPVSDAAKETKIQIGAQNMNDAAEGAFTGEIAGKMLKDAGATFVILGHSERRRLFHESDEFINRKVKRALLDGLQPILCIGETLEQRESGQTEEVLASQLTSCLDGIKTDQLVPLTLAYEPVWAIGTGRNATADIAEHAHSFCRNWLAMAHGEEVANQMRIIYGGSVNPENAKYLIQESDIDGLLIGGASLFLDSFIKIVNDISLTDSGKNL
jgi:triosephosphate isomerase